MRIRLLFPAFASIFVISVLPAHAQESQERQDQAVKLFKADLEVLAKTIEETWSRNRVARANPRSQLAFIGQRSSLAASNRARDARNGIVEALDHATPPGVAAKLRPYVAEQLAAAQATAKTADEFQKAWADEVVTIWTSLAELTKLASEGKLHPSPVAPLKSGGVQPIYPGIPGEIVVPAPPPVATPPRAKNLKGAKK